MRTFRFFVALALAGSSAFAVTVDRVKSFGAAGDTGTYDPGAYNAINLFSTPTSLILSDGTEWAPGAGFAESASAQVNWSGEAGTMVDFHFKPLLDSSLGAGAHVFLSTTSFGFGPSETPYSTAFTLVYEREPVLRAALGSRTAHWSGYAKLVSTTPLVGEISPDFIFPRAALGSYVFFSVEVENLTRGWEVDSFGREFDYRVSGSIDFTRQLVTPVPEPSTYAVAAVLLLLGVGLRRRLGARLASRVRADGPQPPADLSAAV